LAAEAAARTRQGRWCRRGGGAIFRRVPAIDRELRLLRAYAVLTYPFACVPFLFFYFRSCGLDLTGYGTAIAVYYLTMFAADVPTSVLADRCGRRAMLVLGPLLLAAGFLLLFVWRSFAGFCAGEALMGLGHSVLSGPPSALLYQLLLRAGQQHRYLHEEARIHALRLYGTGSSFLLGGVLAFVFADEHGYGFAAAIPPTCALCVAAAAIATRLGAEPPSPASSWRVFWRRLRADLSLRAVRWLLVYWLLLFALLRYPFHNYQVVLDETAAIEPLARQPLFVGALFAALNLTAAPLSRRVPELVARYGRRLLFWAMPLLLGASLVALALVCWLAPTAGGFARPLVWVGLLLFFVQQVPFGMHWALVQEFVNHRIAEPARATVWSVLSLGGRLCYAPVNQLLFALQQTHGTAMVLGGAGCAGLLLSAMVLRRRPPELFAGPPQTPAA
jgi:MFS family permease